MASADPRRAGEVRRIIILGGGFGGAYAAKALEGSLPVDWELMLIDRNNFLTFYPLLVEAAVGSIEPRHVVVPLRKFARRSFHMGEVLDVDLDLQRVHFQPVGTSERRGLHYDQLIISVGSVTRSPSNVPGLAEYGFALKSLGEGIALRDRAIQLMEMASDMADAADRRAALTFVIVGANFTGIELAGEYGAFLDELLESYPSLSRSDVTIKVLEYGDRILNTMPDGLVEYVKSDFAQRGIEIIYFSTVTEVGSDYCILKDGARVPTRTVIWTAGVQPSPVLGLIKGLPRNEKGYIPTGRDLRVQGYQNVWAVGDAATVPAPDGGFYAPTAQNAIRQGPLVAQNVLAAIRGEPISEFTYRPVGSFAVIGRRRAAAEFKHREFRGFIGWFMFRSAYLFKMPTFSMKARLAMDWLLEFFLKAPIVQLGVHRPNPKAQPTDSAATSQSVQIKS